jgi:hypothetical protein
MSVEIRDTTKQDWIERFGFEPAYSFRGITITDDDRIVCVGGVTYQRPPYAFMDWDEDYPRKRILVAATRRFFDKVKETHKYMYAIAKDNETAPVFLEHFGFEYHHTELNGEGVYIWRNT